MRPGVGPSFVYLQTNWISTAACSLASRFAQLTLLPRPKQAISQSPRSPCSGAVSVLWPVSVSFSALPLSVCCDFLQQLLLLLLFLSVFRSLCPVATSIL